jgi:hypothetical protein
MDHDLYYLRVSLTMRLRTHIDKGTGFITQLGGNVDTVFANVDGSRLGFKTAGDIATSVV